jgi:hypothetical protein
MILSIVPQFCGGYSHIVCRISSICCSHTHAQPCECGSLDLENLALSMLTSVITGTPLDQWERWPGVSGYGDVIEQAEGALGQCRSLNKIHL